MEMTVPSGGGNRASIVLKYGSSERPTLLAHLFFVLVLILSSSVCGFASGQQLAHQRTTIHVEAPSGALVRTTEYLLLGISFSIVEDDASGARWVKLDARRDSKINNVVGWTVSAGAGAKQVLLVSGSDRDDIARTARLLSERLDVKLDVQE